MTEHIQIGDVAPRVQYTADGALTVFTYAFPIFQENDLAVYLGEASQDTGYTVAGAGNSSGGAVTFDTAPADGTVVTLRRALAIQRTTDFQEGGEFRAKVINDELDYQTAALQQVEAEAARGLKLSPTDTATSMEIPPKADRADRQLGFDGNGDLIVTDGVPGPTGPAGADGADGADGVFSGGEATVAIADADLVALLDDSDSGNPKFALWSAMKADAQYQAASQAEMEAGTETALRAMSPAGVKQAIDALAGGGGGLPIGAVIDWPGPGAPSTGVWLDADGSNRSRTTYADLFAEYGTTWGVGDGSTTFGTPDLRGRMTIGDGTGSGLTARTLADTGGEEDHALTSGEGPSHTHSMPVGNQNNDVDGPYACGSNAAPQIGSSRSTGSSGSGTAHENMPPFVVVRKLIKAGD